MKKIQILSVFIVCTVLTSTSRAQSCSGLNLQLKAEIPSTCNTMVMTMIHDALDRPYLYVANKEGGLKIYDITNLGSPSLLATIPKNLLNNLDVMNLHQDGNYLYLALGNTFTNPQQGGMGIVDVGNPSAPSVSDVYMVPGSANGAGIVKTEGNYAYLGAMKSGLVIFDVSDKNNIVQVGQLIPAINFPPVSNPNPDLYNARGMEVKNSIVYLCYDAGGIRIINCTVKSAPVETGRWCNPAMYTPLNHPKAYNNLVLDGNFLYVAVDYCGLEVIDITDTGNMKLHGWWNPYHCPGNNWFTSPSHTNEIQFESSCKRIYLSTGKSDMVVVDVSNPAQPDSCNFYGGVANNIGTWGIGLYKDQIYLSYICAIIPFSSNWTGVKILTFNSCQTGTENTNLHSIGIYPNPTQEKINIRLSPSMIGSSLAIYDTKGQAVWTIPEIQSGDFLLDVSMLGCGLYTALFRKDGRIITGKFTIER